MANERELAIAGVYARALLDLAVEADREEEVREELAELARLLDTNDAFARAVADPLVDAEVLERLVEKTLRGRLSDLVVDTLQVMNRKGRLSLVAALARAYAAADDERLGRVEVEVTTAVPLDDDRRRALARAASRFTGKQAVVNTTVDPGLLGGMVVRIGDRKIDTSIARELRRLGDRLHDRASREVQAGRDYMVEG